MGNARARISKGLAKAIYRTFLLALVPHAPVRKEQSGFSRLGNCVIPVRENASIQMECGDERKI